MPAAKKKTTASGKKRKAKTGTAVIKKKSLKGKKRIPVKKKTKDNIILKDVAAVALGVFCVLLLISCFTSNGGILGIFHVYNFMLFGVMAYIIPFILFFTVCFIIANIGNEDIIKKLLAIVLFIIGFTSFASILKKSFIENSHGGGIIGDFFTGMLISQIGTVGAYIITFAVLFISLLLFFGHIIVENLQSVSGNMVDTLQSKHKIKSCSRKIKSNERRIQQQKERNRLLEEQKQKLEQLQEEHQEQVRQGVRMRELIDVSIKTNDPPVVDADEIKKADRSYKAVKKELRTDSELEKADRNSGKLHNNIVQTPTVIIGGMDVTEDMSEVFDKEPDEPEIIEPPQPTQPQQPKQQKQVQQPVTEPEIKEEDGVRTKTVTTSTGKVITVELDGLPGENKRPRESKIRTNMDQYSEKVIPVEYEEPKEYVFPPVSLLHYGKNSLGGKDEIARNLKETASRLAQTLQDFGVGVTITNISRGPSVTRYELMPEQGVKVSRIVALTDDIKLNLAAEDIRMEAPIPGKAAIGIEVPNKEKQAVAFRELIESDEFKKSRSKTVFAAGKDIAGKTVIADIEKMPHLLIAGATGSGKSVCINTIIMSILYKAKPSEVKLIMIDPKVVELSVYNGIPHLLIPVVTDPKKAAAALNWAVNEMEERYKKFSKVKARNIEGYNAAVEQAEKAGGSDAPKKMPQIIVIVDELADLIMTAAGDVEDAIQKLAQKARAAGIHLIIATQRPSVNVITGVIKANIPSRIAFSVSSGVDSRTIIDMNGAEKLLGKGDMLFDPYYVSKPMRVQGAFVSDEEVADVVDFLLQQKNVIGGEVNTDIDLKSNMPGSKPADSDTDELFYEAGMFIIEQQKASIGLLQRHFRIGFNRAARIMDQLYEAGVVSKDEGTKPRNVLMTAEQFEQGISQQ